MWQFPKQLSDFDRPSVTSRCLDFQEREDCAPRLNLWPLFSASLVCVIKFQVELQLCESDSLHLWTNKFTLRCGFHDRIKKCCPTLITIGFVIQAKNGRIWPFLNNGGPSFRLHKGFVEFSDYHTSGKFERSVRLKPRQFLSPGRWWWEVFFFWRESNYVEGRVRATATVKFMK